jgi:hypothetical protein
MTQTRRQQIAELISAQEWNFEELRHELSVTVKVIEEDLHHIERSVRASGKRFVVRSAICVGCGFAFTKKALHPPGRCPQCRDRRIDGPWVKITG